MAKRKQRLAPVPRPRKLTRRATAVQGQAARPRALQLVDDRPRGRPHQVSDKEREEGEQTVVGIGASAGGLEAVQKLVEHLNPTGGLAYVLVQHLAPQHESFLAELLNTTSQIPVVQAEERMRLKSDRLHVIPPNVHMTIADGRLHLAPRPLDHTKYNPIDSFFESMARHAQDRSVGVVLSGTASDGAAGLREIKAVGGLTIAQDPGTAKYDGMPRAAIATGVVDLILSPEAIATELVRIGAHPFLQAGSAVSRVPELAVTETQLQKLFHLLRVGCGVDFAQYKLPTVKRRLTRRMALHRTTDVDRYLTILESEPTELRNLYRDILIHVTRFFRDPDSFVALKTLVFPRIVTEGNVNRPIRIWVPGCATGEEAYSIAIALLEYLGDDVNSTPMQVFATDVSEEAIERARAGVYPESIAGDVSPERLRRFFTRLDNQYRVSKIVRDTCIFARQDLTRDPPFSKLDLIVCRNVLIYLGQRLQRRLIGVFDYALKPSGFLMLGSAESVGTQVELFAIQDKRHKVYTKRAGRSLVDVQTGPLFEIASDRGRPELRGVGARPLTRGSDVQAEVTRLLLGRYSPPGVVVDSELQILQTRGRTGPFLELSSGEASLNLLKMAREGLLHALRSALQEAKRSGKAARREGLMVKSEDGAIETDLQIIPFTDANDSAFFLVLFEEPPPRTANRSNLRKAVNPQSRSKEDTRVVRLQQELSSSREYLQSIIQDLEAANEELQSANEEILSSNEELQSTNEELDTAKEELQSTNEELNTVNEELNARNDELSHANSDLVNLLSAVPTAVVMVTSDLRIRRFTPLAEQLLNLIPSDVGRPLGDIKPNLDLPDLAGLVREVLDSVSPQEREVADRSGRLYALRIRPYKDHDNRIDGAVLALTEVTRTAS
jgi:two-component system CheB/CheR fusion protein